MLPAYIIEELRRREVARREHERRPTLDLPIPAVRPGSETDDESTTPERGVVIIELMR